MRRLFEVAGAVAIAVALPLVFGDGYITHVAISVLIFAMPLWIIFVSIWLFTRHAAPEAGTPQQS